MNISYKNNATEFATTCISVFAILQSHKTYSIVLLNAVSCMNDFIILVNFYSKKASKKIILFDIFLSILTTVTSGKMTKMIMYFRNNARLRNYN